jgi:hypothetical protein
MERAWRKYLEESLKILFEPHRYGYIRRINELQQMSLIARKTLVPLRKNFKEAGFEEKVKSMTPVIGTPSEAGLNIFYYIGDWRLRS